MSTIEITLPRKRGAGEPPSFVVATEKLNPLQLKIVRDYLPLDRQNRPVLRGLNDREVLEIAIIENVQRQDLSPLEEATGYARLMEEFDYTQEQLAERIGKSRPHIANMLRLLDLPQRVRDLLSSGDLTPGHARALIKADDPVALAEQVVAQGLNVRQTEALAQAHKPDEWVELSQIRQCETFMDRLAARLAR